MDKDLEGDGKVEGTSLTIAEELILDGNPGLGSSATTMSCSSTVRAPRIQYRITLSIRRQEGTDRQSSVRTSESRA
jgi:hypothetical protein